MVNLAESREHIQNQIIESKSLKKCSKIKQMKKDLKKIAKKFDSIQYTIQLKGEILKPVKKNQQNENRYKDDNINYLLTGSDGDQP